MGNTALSSAIALIAALVAAVSLVRLATTGGGTRFAASGDLLMGLCMAFMALPATAAWYGAHGMWWASLFAVLGLGGMVMAVHHTRTGGWKQGRHWTHLIIGSAGMVIMTLAMTSTPSGPVLALGGSMAGMPGMENTHGMEAMPGMEGMEGMEEMEGMSMPGMTGGSADAASSAESSSLWRGVVMALAVYFLLSLAASVWTRVHGTERSTHVAGREAGRHRSWTRWLLAMPDAIVVFLASLTLSVWDRARLARKNGSVTDDESRRRPQRRRRRIGASPDAALAAHLGMGATMSAMLLMMAV